MAQNQTSDAVVADGTTLEISSGLSGNTETVTGITQATEAVVSATGHSIVVGDVVQFAGVVGMIEVNGNDYPVIATTANDFTLDLDSSDFTAYTSGGTADPHTFVATKEHKTVQITKDPRQEIDNTTLVSRAKEVKLGKEAGGTMSCQINRVESEAAQMEMRIAERGQERPWRLLKANDYYLIFSGLVQSIGQNLAVDSIADGQLDVKISGYVTEVLKP